MANDQAINTDLVQFTASQLKFLDYPLNLVRTADFSYTLKAYSSRLARGEATYFNKERPRIRIWDLVTSQDKSHVGRTVKDLDELKEVLGETVEDPYRRFIFLRSGSSRFPLDCSREMMYYLFTYHQIMARLLDFTSTFKQRDTPHSFTLFRNEDYLGSEHYQPGLSAMGRSGIRIQHCFNLLGIERNRDSSAWLLRQVAAYHSFDLIQGRALWAVIKEDFTIQRRLESITQESAREKDMSLDTTGGAFSQTLEDHLLIIQWCVENWDTYTEDIEDKYRNLSGVAEYDPVKDLVNDTMTVRKRDKLRAILPSSHSRHQANGSAEPAHKPGFLRRLTRKTVTDCDPVSHVDTLNPKIPEHDIIGNFGQIDRLQSLSCLDRDLSKAISSIDQNKRVLAEIKEHYRDLVDSAGFSLHIKDKSTLKKCKEAVSQFIMKVGTIEGDLNNYQGRFRTILRSVEATEAMHKGILQFKTMCIASSSEQSAEIMKTWTGEMHEKTMSMHVITIFTLIFLPGTFVATIFSSGIMTFGEDGSGGFGSSMGSWKVRPAGLKLYAAICFPLLALTLSAWLYAYYSARRKIRTSMSSGGRGGGASAGGYGVV